jgi:uncharacterized protein YkwD
MVGLLLAIAAPLANAARPGARHGKARAHSVKTRAHAVKTRGHRPKGHARGRRPTPKRSAAATCANADLPASSRSSLASDAAVLCLINQQRAAHHLPALHENTKLDRAAQSWTNTMVQTASFSHGTNFSGRIDAVGYAWQGAAENVGTGYATPRGLVTAYMASPDHCRNILNPSYADVGAGVLARGIAPYGPSTWTQDFGLSSGQAAPSSNHGPMNACPYGGLAT